MAKVSFVICITLSTLAASRGLAQQYDLLEKLTLPEALRYAREHSPLLLAAREDVRAAQGGELTARLRPNPSFNLVSESYPLFESTRGPFFNNQELTMTVELPVETARKRYWRHRVASAFREFVDSQSHDAQRVLTLRVQQAYAQVLLAQAEIESARELLADYDRILAVNKARFDQGEISGGELRRVEIERFRFLDDVLTSENSLRNSKAALLAIIGFPDVRKDFAPADGLDVRSVEQSLAQLMEDALRYRPDMAAQRFRALQARNNRALEKANVIPTIIPFFGYKRDLGMNTLAFGVRLPLPLFNRNQGEVARAEAEERGEDFRLRVIEQRIRQEVAEAYNSFRTQERRLKEIQDFYLKRARESRDITAESYRLGAIDLLNLLDVQRAYREVVRIHNRARYGAVVGRFELEAAVGKEL